MEAGARHSPARLPGELADCSTLRFAGGRRLRGQPSLALASVLALAAVIGGFARARAFTAVDPHAVNAGALFRGGRGGDGSAQRQGNRRGGKRRAGKNINFHLGLQSVSSMARTRYEFRNPFRTADRKEVYEAFFEPEARCVTKNYSLGSGGFKNPC